jgi:hypothetical protein
MSIRYAAIASSSRPYAVEQIRAQLEEDLVPVLFVTALKVDRAVRRSRHPLEAVGEPSPALDVHGLGVRLVQPRRQQRLVVPRGGGEPQHRLPRHTALARRRRASGKPAPLLERHQGTARPFGHLRETHPPRDVVRHLRHCGGGHAVGVFQVARAEEHFVGQRVALVVVGAHGLWE